MTGIDIIKLRISEKNEDVAAYVRQLKNRNGGMYSDELCRLIRNAYKIDKYTNVPAMDAFCRNMIRGKTVAEALYEGYITEEEISSMFMSCKIFLEEMYSSPTLQRIVDRNCGHIDCTKMRRGLDSWQLQH